MKVKRIKKGTSSFTPCAVASDGTNFYVQGHLKVYRDKGKRLGLIAETSYDDSTEAPNRSISQGREHLVFADDALWACGNSIQTSNDRGESWFVVDIERYEGGYFRHLEVTRDGIYAGGILEERGLLAYRPHGGDFATLANAPDVGISMLLNTDQGLFLGDVEGGVWLASSGALEKLFQIDRNISVSDSDLPICWCAMKTQQGTLLLVGAEGVFRSADGGKTFEQTSEEVFSTLQQLPSGEIVAVGMSIMVSSDDGLRWEELLEFENVGYSEKKKSCLHGESVLIASFADGLFQVTNDAD